jgi:hypothetical protein
MHIVIGYCKIVESHFEGAEGAIITIKVYIIQNHEVKIIGSVTRGGYIRTGLQLTPRIRRRIPVKNSRIVL